MDRNEIVVTIPKRLARADPIVHPAEITGRDRRGSDPSFADERVEVSDIVPRSGIRVDGRSTLRARFVRFVKAHDGGGAGCDGGGGVVVEVGGVVGVIAPEHRDEFYAGGETGRGRVPVVGPAAFGAGEQFGRAEFTHETTGATSVATCGGVFDDWTTDGSGTAAGDGGVDWDGWGSGCLSC